MRSTYRCLISCIKTATALLSLAQRRQAMGILEILLQNPRPFTAGDIRARAQSSNTDYFQAEQLMEPSLWHHVLQLCSLVSCKAQASNTRPEISSLQKPSSWPLGRAKPFPGEVSRCFSGCTAQAMPLLSCQLPRVWSSSTRCSLLLLQRLVFSLLGGGHCSRDSTSSVPFLRAPFSARERRFPGDESPAPELPRAPGDISC